MYRRILRRCRCRDFKEVLLKPIKHVIEHSNHIIAVWRYAILHDTSVFWLVCFIVLLSFGNVLVKLFMKSSSA